MECQRPLCQVASEQPPTQVISKQLQQQQTNPVLATLSRDSILNKWKGHKGTSARNMKGCGGQIAFYISPLAVTDIMYILR